MLPDVTERRRVVRWDRQLPPDPALSGLDSLRAMAAGRRPRPPASSLIGLAMRSAEAGRVTMAMTPAECHYNPIGTVHGGVVATVLDTVLACSVLSKVPAGRGCMTLEIKVNYLRAITEATGEVVGEGECLHAGNQVSVAQGRITDAKGRVYATASTTMLVFDLPPPRAFPTDTALEREIVWEDPRIGAAAGRGMAGIDYLRAMQDGTIPRAPIARLLGFEMTDVAPGRVEMTLPPGRAHDEPGRLDAWRHDGDAAGFRDGVRRALHRAARPRLHDAGDQGELHPGGDAGERADHRSRRGGAWWPADGGGRRPRGGRRRPAGRDGEHHLPAVRPAPRMSVALDRPALSPRTARLLQGPILATLLRLAWPNVLVMLAQSATGLIETFWVAKLGTDALAGMALVFPGVMLMQMISGGAMGGGISSAIARALGSRRNDDADALVLHAVVINVVLGLLFSASVLLGGPALYRALGGSGASLEAALIYSNIVFATTVLLWLMNAFASVIRGTGNMLFPALVTVGGVLLLVPISPCLIFGLGPFPALGVAGGGAALAVFYAGGTVVLGWYVLAGRAGVRLRWRRMRWSMFRDILAVGAVASVSAVQTNLTVALVMAMAAQFGGPDAVAGYGTGARLEYLLIPLVFGLGAPLVTMVGTNIGAGQRARALRIAWTGAALAFMLTEAVGLLAAGFPEAWIGLFGHNPAMLATGATYLRFVGPAYGFFGAGLALYFASQGAGRLLWPLLAGLARVVVAVGGGWLLLQLTGSVTGLFVALALGLVTYGVVVAVAVRAGAWFHGKEE